MAQRIVDIFEMVDVQVHQCDVRAMPTGERDCLRQPVYQQRPVWQACERIVRRHVRYLRCAQLGRVLHGLGPDDRDHQPFVGLAQLNLDQQVLVGAELQRSVTLLQRVFLQRDVRFSCCGG